MGFTPVQQFPVFADHMPNQLLAYIRLARIQDPALFAKVSFEQDVVLSQMNEYEVLQLLMGDCRERLAMYASSLEEDIKNGQASVRAKPLSQRSLILQHRFISSQRQDMSVRERLAVKLRLSEVRSNPTTSPPSNHNLHVLA